MEANPTVPPPDPVEAPSIIRRKLRLTKQDFVQYGWTMGCYGCRAQCTRQSYHCMHNERCRSRIEAELAKSADTEVDAQERIRNAVARNVWRSAAVKDKDEKKCSMFRQIPASCYPCCHSNEQCFGHHPCLPAMRGLCFKDLASRCAKEAQGELQRCQISKLAAPEGKIPARAVP